MLNFTQSVEQAVQGAVCSVLAVNDGINGFLEGVSFPGASSYADNTRALRRKFCSNPDPVVPVPPADNIGCYANQDLLPYGGLRVRVQWGVSGDLTENVSRLETYTVGTTRWLRRFRCDGTRIGDVPNATVTVISQNACFQGAEALPPCEPQIPAFSPTTITTNITYEDNSQTTVNEGLDITIFAPIVGINAQIIAPITISGNDFSLVGNVQLSPEFKLELNPEFVFGGGGGSTDSPIPQPDGDFPLPDRPQERRTIIGAIATITNLGNAKVTQIDQNQNPDIFAPRLGNVAFYVDSGNGLAWTEDIPIKNLRQYVECPARYGAVDVRGTAIPGAELNVQPVYATIPGA